jgi:hypothetical protein
MSIYIIDYIIANWNDVVHCYCSGHTLPCGNYKYNSNSIINYYAVDGDQKEIIGVQLA